MDSTLTIRPHPAIGNPGPFVYYVHALPGGKVGLSTSPDARYLRPVMPRASLKHFKNDLEGRVDLPPSHDPTINAVIAGRATLLGKGDDGLAFRVGSKVVKVSTTVPYQPENPGHLSPEQAIRRLKAQTEAHNALVDVVRGSCLRRATFLRHGDKGFQVKPYVEAKRLTLAQLDQLQDCILSMHKAGWVIGDEIQAGVDSQGRPVMFDVGKAERIPSNDAELGIHSRVQRDRERIADLYREHGQTYRSRDADEIERHWEKTAARVLRWAETSVPSKSMLDAVQRAAEARRNLAAMTLKGPALTQRLDVIDDEENAVLEAKPRAKASEGGGGRVRSRSRLRSRSRSPIFLYGEARKR